MQSETLSPELKIITEFMAQCLPFDSLDAVALSTCAADICIKYFRKGWRFSIADGDGLFIVRSGAVDEYDPDEIQQRLESGESFSVAAAQYDDQLAQRHFIAYEDCLIYRLPETAFSALRLTHRHIDRFFHVSDERRLRRAARHRVQASYLSQPVAAVMSCDPLQIDDDCSIHETARRMTQRRVSSIFVMEDGRPAGVITDRDLRSRVVAENLDTSAPARQIMSDGLISVSQDTTVFDAILCMTQRQIHHLAVLADSGDLIGVLTISDINLAREDDPLFFIQRLKRLGTVAALQSQMARLPELFRQWVEASTPPIQLTQLTTAVSDAVTQRLIELAIEKQGPAPQPFCWLGFGSQARGEQLLGGDQDNGLLIADGVLPDEMNWFRDLADFVCDGLNACGYDYCPGDVMAKSEQWRKSLTAWCETVDGWMASPTPAAVMRISIFFDLRPIYGERGLAEQLHGHMLRSCERNTIFLAALADNVLSSSPPLGLFGRLLLERGGEHNHLLDLKKRGVLPIIELVRLHSLAHGVAEVATHKRLQALSRCKAMALVDARNLEDAFSLINGIRIEQQAVQLAAGEEVNNYLAPERLSRLQRQNLKQAFKVVHSAEEGIRLRYRAGL